MSFELQTQTITGNASGTFTFAGNIGAYIYAIQQLNLQTTFPQRIQRIGVSLAAQGSTGVGSDTLTLQQTITMDDVDLSNSWTTVSVLAWLGDPDPAGIFMQNQNGIAVGNTSAALSLSGTPVVAAAAMAGFDFTFGSDDSDFLAIGVSCGAVQNLFAGGSSVAALVQGTLTGDAPFTGTVDAALMAFTAQQPRVAVDVVSNGTLSATNNRTIGPYLGNAPLGSAAMFIQSFFAQFQIPSNPTPDLAQLQMGAPASGIVLNSNNVNGEITYQGTQVLSGDVPGGRYGPISVSAANLQTNHLVVALSS